MCTVPVCVLLKLKRDIINLYLDVNFSIGWVAFYGANSLFNEK